MENDINIDTEKTIPIRYNVRNLTVIPTGINTAIKYNAWKRVLCYATEEMSKLAYLGSTLFNLHLLRLIENGKFEHLDEKFFDKSANMRSWFVSLSPNSKKPKDDYLTESLEIWKNLFPDDTSLPSLFGLQSIVNGQFETYYTCFKNHNTYAIRDHFSWYLKDKYDISKKCARKISDIFFKVDEDKEYEEDEDIEEYKLSNSSLEILEKEQKLFNLYDVESLKNRIKIHYIIQGALTKSNKDDETKNKVFSLAPICSLKTRHINICKSALNDLYNVCTTIYKKGRISSSQKGITFETARDILKIGHPKCIGDILFDEKLKRKHKLEKGLDYSLEFKTNGVEVKLVWEKIVQKTIMITEKEYKKRLVDNEKRRKEKKEKLENQIKDKGKIDKRSTIPRAPKIEKTSVFPSKTSFENETKGFFSKTSIIESNIKENTLIVACDPGHKNIVTTSRCLYKKDEPMKFKKGFSLSLGQYYNDIGHKHYLKKNENRKKENKHIENIELVWSKHTLKVHSLVKFIENLNCQLENWNEYSCFYRSNKMTRLCFSNHIKKQKLIQHVERKMCPNKDTIIANGSANFAKSRPGLSATPVAKIMTKIAESKRVALTPEQYTTCRCSMCQDTTDKMKDLYGNTTFKDKKGVTRNRKIHGLKQCTHCNRLWARDLNSSISIGNAFVHLNKYGTRPNYLKPMMTVDLLTQGSVVQMCEETIDTIPQSYLDEKRKY